MDNLSEKNPGPQRIGQVTNLTSRKFTPQKLGYSTFDPSSISSFLSNLS